MIAKRSKNKALGLLPRMDARKRADGGYTYRYLTHDRRYINLGRDRAEAIRKVLEIEHRAPDTGTIASLINGYMSSSQFRALGATTQRDYIIYAKPLLRVFGDMQAADLQPPHIARYLRIERASAPVSANREMAMLSSVYQFGIECGAVRDNPCRQVRRNREKPRSRCPSWDELHRFCTLAKAKGLSSHIIGLMAQFAALTGRRRAEFIKLRRDDVRPDGIQVQFAKDKAGEAVRRGLIERAPAIDTVIADTYAALSERSIQSVFVFATRSGQPYTNDGFTTMWQKLMIDWEAGGNERFNFHDLRALYVTQMVERDIDPETHINPATTRRIYDRRRTVKIKSSG